FIDRRGNLVRFRALLLNRLTRFVSDPAELFSGRSHLIRGGAHLPDGVLHLDHKVIEAAAQFSEFIFPVLRQTLAQVAVAIGDLLHHVTDLVQGGRYGTTYNQAHNQRDNDHNNGQQKNEAHGRCHGFVDVFFSSGQYPLDIRNVNSGPDHPVPAGNDGGVGDFRLNRPARGRIWPFVRVETIFTGRIKKTSHQPQQSGVADRPFSGGVWRIGQVVRLASVGKHVVVIARAD